MRSIAVTSADDYPRQYARTHRFAFGAPNTFTVSPDGQRVLFLRTRSSTDAASGLWLLEDGAERLVYDPTAEGELSVEEKARRERMRVHTSGVVGYSTDRDVRLVAFALGGRLWLSDLTDSREVDTAVSVIDPRLSPSGSHVAYVGDDSLRVVGADGGDDRALAAPEAAEVSYGLAEHVAGESMFRDSGFWWSPDGQTLLVARVDNSPVQTWYLSDPSTPEVQPVAVKYPAAGTDNALVTLHLVGLDGSRVEVDWDRERFEYVTAASWDDAGLLIAVQSRDQATVQVLSVAADGSTALVREETDEAWVELVPGTPARTASGDLVWVSVSKDDDTRELVVGTDFVTPAGLQVREVCGVDGDTVLFTASPVQTETRLYSYAGGEVRELSDGPGVFTGTSAGGTTVVHGLALDRFGRRAVVHTGESRVELRSLSEQPVLATRMELLTLGERELPAAVFWPTSYELGSGRLPVLLDPYGGPHGQLVVSGQFSHHTTAQWFAEQGFVVLTVDGRGTPGRSPSWEKSVRGDKLDPPLQDQVDALHALAARYPDVDLGRVAIRGWSYGGSLAAAGVIRRPDVFHAAVSGAPVTEARLYDTHWQERYLGHPDQNPDAYDRSSAIRDAAKLDRPLLLVHGFADDNVVVAHTLRLSAALLAAGRPHTVIPLTGGATHMAVQEEISENLLRLELSFLQTHLTP